MSARAAIVAFVLCAGCTSQQPAAPRPPAAPQIRDDPAPTVETPSKPTAAFSPANAGRCPADYRLIQGTCVHGAYAVSGEPLSRALAEYRRGIAPPMLGPTIPKARDLAPRGPLGPGALSRPGEADAGTAKERRLAELDAMIAVAKEKLRERDESSKAKRVEGPKPGAGDAGPARVTTIVGGTPGAGAFEVTAPEDPTAARMAELSRLTNMLCSEQIQAMSGELDKLGLDAKQLEALVGQSRGDLPRQP